METEKTLGVLICEALNVPANRTGNIEIHIPPSREPVRVKLDMFFFKGELDNIDWRERLKGANVTVFINYYIHGEEDENSGVGNNVE